MEDHPGSYELTSLPHDLFSTTRWNAGVPYRNQSQYHRPCE
jgi:hypothetical protein